MRRRRTSSGEERRRRAEDAVQAVSNVGFLLDASTPLTQDQVVYEALLENQAKKLVDPYNEDDPGTN